MTQTALPTTTVYRTWGKDHLSDSWTCYEARFRWQAVQWADARAFTQRNADEEVQVAAVAPEGRSRIEWRVDGVWLAYTAWEGPERRVSQIEWIEREVGRFNSRQTFRVAIEDQPRTVVGI
jgi:hypothetical protein